MSKLAAAEKRQWADGPYPLIETPKHKQGIVSRSQLLCNAKYEH